MPSIEAEAELSLRLATTRINTDSVVNKALDQWNSVSAEHITWTWEVMYIMFKRVGDDCWHGRNMLSQTI